MNKKGWQCFLNICHSTPNDKMLSELFELLLTPEEKSSLETRCLIIQALLDKKRTQREIAKDLAVSIAKITRGSNELKRISSKLKTHLQNIFLMLKHQKQE